MVKMDSAESKFLAMFRRRIVDKANKIHKLVKYAENWRMVPLTVEDFLKAAEKNLIQAYQLLPDK